MRRLLIPAAACLLMLLGACDESDSPPTSTPLPPLPADIRTCFVGVVDIPARALTIGDVEKLWKTDRVRAVVMQRCGVRLLAFYDDLRRSWR